MDVSAVIIILILFNFSPSLAQDASPFQIVSAIKYNNDFPIITDWVNTKVVSNQNYLVIVTATNLPSGQFSTILCYSFKNQSWTTLPDINYFVRPSIIIYRDNIIITGTVFSNLEVSIYKYSLSKQEWTRHIPSGAIVRAEMELLLHDRNLYMVGGSHNRSPVSEIVIIDPDTLDSVVLARAALSQKRGQVSITKLGDLAIIAGGRIADQGDFPQYTSVVDVYNITSDSIIRSYTANVGTVNGAVCATAVRDRIFVAYKNAVDIYDITTAVQTSKDLFLEMEGVMASISVLDQYSLFFYFSNNMNFSLTVYNAQSQNWTTSILTLPKDFTLGFTKIPTSSSQNFAFVIGSNVITISKPCASDNDCNNVSDNACVASTKCSLETGMCVDDYVPEGTLCDDGIWCNGEEDQCDGYGECTHSGSPCKSDLPCNDTCNEIEKSCFRPFNESCPTGVCNGHGVCGFVLSTIHTVSINTMELTDDTEDYNSADNKVPDKIGVVSALVGVLAVAALHTSF